MSLAQHRLLKSTDAAFGEALAISTTQLGVLFVLEKNPGAILKEVSEALGINKSAITALIGRMEDRELIRRAESDDDGRAIRLFPTSQGLAKVAAARPILAGLNARLTEGFSDRDLAAVERFLNAIQQRF